MALSEKTINRHNIKRAEVFAANGLNDLDVQYAHPHFEGYGRGTCSLCGKQNLKWLFSIKFDAPSCIVALAKIETDIDRDAEVTLTPIGSKCITDWLDAVPETREKLDALKRWKTEMDRCKKAMTAKVVEDLCAQAGYPTPQDAFNAYQNVSHGARWKLPRKDRRRLGNNAYKVKHKTLSRGTLKLWLENLDSAIQIDKGLTAGVEVAPEPSKPGLPDADAAVIERGRIAWVNRDRLRPHQAADFKDIGEKVVKFGGFRSGAQRRYYTDMLRRLETVPQ